MISLNHALVHELVTAAARPLLTFIAISIAATAIGLACSHRRRLSAGSRHLVLSLALLAPLAGALIALTGAGETTPVTVTSITAPPVTITATADFERPSELACNLLAIWLTGVVVFAAASARQWLYWARVARRAPYIVDANVLAAFDAACKRVARTPQLCVAAEATEPMVVGVFGSTVLLPEGHAALLDERELVAVFAHELEHVRRRDNLTAIAHEIACALFWFDPLHWIARRRVLELRERACDERVLDLGCSARPYVAALAKSCHAAIESPSVACMSGFHVRERIDSIMSYPSDRSRFLPEKRVRLAVAATGVIVVGLLATIAPLPTFADSPQPQPYNFNVRVGSGPAGEILIHATVFTPAGERLIESNATTAAGEAVHFSTTRGAATYTIDVTPGEPGVWTSTLKVSREGNVIYTETTQQSAPRSVVPAPTATPPGYMRVGGGVTAPTVLKRVEPSYTPEAKAARISGIVILQVMLDETGVVRDVLVLKNLPLGLGEKAAEAIRQWTFVPGTMDGKPVPVIYNVTVNFKGDDE